MSGPATSAFRAAFFSSSFSIENYYLSVAAHEEALREAGFRTIRWLRPRLSPDGEAQHGAKSWKPFLDSPPITFIECIK